MSRKPLIITKEEIKKIIRPAQVIRGQEEGFSLYSKGACQIPPFGSLHFQKPPGTVHIKHGVITGDLCYVVKIASGFYDNPKAGIASSQGLMLIFNSRTGELEAILLDQAFLTEYRTGAAGAVAAKYLAPKNVSAIGMIGTGTQAFFQLLLLKEVIPCNKVLVWGRSFEKAKQLAAHPELSHYEFEIASDIREIAKVCNLIVTTTPSRSPLLFAEEIRPGTHITAVGADGGGKQELDPQIFRIADVIAADSRAQCLQHGDISFAVQKNLIDPAKIVELGEILNDPARGRRDQSQVTVADLTGVAIQDIQIAKDVYNHFTGAMNGTTVLEPN